MNGLRRPSRRMVLSWLVIGLMASWRASEAREPQTQNVVRTAPHEAMVTIRSVLKRRSTREDLLLVAYSYSFPGRSTVYIRGVGLVPAAGDLTYLTPDSYLEFRDAAQGTALKTVLLQETTVVLSPATIDLPDRTTFPNAYLEGPWLPVDALAQTVVRVVQSHFPSGLSTRQLGDLSLIVTMFVNLPVGDSNLRSQIAVEVSHPYLPKAGTAQFKLRFTARDRPRLSDEWRYGGDRNPATLERAEEFVRKLLAELSQGRSR